MCDGVYQSAMCCEFSALATTPCHSLTVPHLQIGSRPIDNKIAAVVPIMTITAAMVVRVVSRRLYAALEITADRAHEAIHFFRRVVEVRRGAQAAPILAAAAGGADLVLLVERLAEFLRVERAGQERDDRGVQRRIRRGPHLHVGQLRQSLDQLIGKLARSLLDRRAADLGLEIERL